MRTSTERAELHRDAWSVWGQSRFTANAYRRLRQARLYDEWLDVVAEYEGRLVEFLRLLGGRGVRSWLLRTNGHSAVSCGNGVWAGGDRRGAAKAPGATACTPPQQLPPA